MNHIFTIIIAVLFLVTLYAGQARAFCFEEAGREHNVSPLLLWAIAKVESNFNPTAINKNENGSYDYGVMQINTWWYPKLGQEKWDKLSDPCENVKTGAWILSQCIEKHGLTWEAVGCYNAVSPRKREKYAEKVQQAVIEAQRLLEQQKPKPQISEGQQSAHSLITTSSGLPIGGGGT